MKGEGVRPTTAGVSVCQNLATSRLIYDYVITLRTFAVVVARLFPEARTGRTLYLRVIAVISRLLGRPRGYFWTSPRGERVHHMRVDSVLH